MKKYFLYLIVVLAMSFMLCACGEHESDGIIGASPHPSEDIYIDPDIMPSASPSIMPEGAPNTSYPEGTSNPQVGSSTEGSADSKP